eukprot:TRINITY_DN52877_c0_g1_i1.p1 TRINITY_DN52877_c0_g1~~TRINITY_DN52877_c0_g1_i1.p1  ORF type:complete len:673 (+),score=19.84 TRINITY_DN52877_c0_g1_i1:25-2043(+)
MLPHLLAFLGLYTTFTTATNCQVGQWSRFSACSAFCGGGTQQRTRVVQGKECTHVTIDTNECNVNPCICKPACPRFGYCSKTGGCACLPGYQSVQNGGSFLCAPTCKMGCKQNERCTGANICTCIPNYYMKNGTCTPEAASAKCPSGCGKHASCVQNGVCACVDGYKMTATGCQPSCAGLGGCVAGANCVAPNVCKCKEGHDGSGAKLSPTTGCHPAQCWDVPGNACDVNAVCERDGVCKCKQGWEGDGAVGGTGCYLVCPRCKTHMDSASCTDDNTCKWDTKTSTCTSERCCKVGQWSSWSSCSASCGGGMAVSTRPVVVFGPDCPVTTKSRACNNITCTCAECFGLKETECKKNPKCGYRGSRCVPECCEVGEWSTWSDCSAMCSPHGSSKGGTRTRTRKVIRAGSYCPQKAHLTAHEQCNVEACCSANGGCTHGAHCNTKMNTCECPAGMKGDGTVKGTGCTQASGCYPPCNTTTSYCLDHKCYCIRSRGWQPTSKGGCERACTVSAWGEWGKCSKACGRGLKTRSRETKGTNCSAYASTESRECNIDPCRGCHLVGGCNKCRNQPNGANCTLKHHVHSLVTACVMGHCLANASYTPETLECYCNPKMPDRETRFGPECKHGGGYVRSFEIEKMASLNTTFGPGRWEWISHHALVAEKMKWKCEMLSPH